MIRWPRSVMPDKVAWLMRVDRETRKLDPRVMQVMASVTAVHEVVLIATSDGDARGGRAAAGALQCFGDRRAERPA